MADNVVVTAGAGTTIAADELTDATLGSCKVQYVKIMDGTLDGTSKAAVGANGLKVDPSGVTSPVSAASLPLPSGASTAAKQPALGTAGTASADVITVQGIASMTALKTDGSGVTQPVSAASLPLPSGAATAAKQPALGTAGSASADVISVQGVASMTALKVDGSGVTQPVSGTLGITANSSVNLNQAAGTALDVNSGNKSAGTIRVVLATDQPALTNKLLVTPDSVALPANQSVNVSQMAGTTTDTNSGNKSAGTQRIVIATDQPQLTNAFKVDGSGVTQPVSGTVTANQGGAPWSENITQFGGNALATGAGAGGNGVPRVTVSNDSQISDLVATGSITTQNLSPNSGADTAASAVVTANLNSTGTATIQVTGTYTGALSGMGTVDGSNWIAFGGTAFQNINTGVFSATIPSAATSIYQVDVSGFKKFKITGLAAMTGTATVTIQTSSVASMIGLDAPLPAGTNQIGKVQLSDGSNAVSNITANADGSSNTRNQMPIDSRLEGYNGSTWDRIRTALIGVQTTLTGMLNTLPLMQYSSSILAPANGNVLPLQSNANGQLMVSPYAVTQIALNPTISTSAYATGNNMGGVLTFANAVRISGGSGRIKGIIITDSSKQNVAMDITFFSATPAAQTDRTATAISASDLALIIGQTNVSNYASFNATSAAFVQCDIPIKLAATSLFALTTLRGAGTYTSTAVRFILLIEQD